MLRQINIEDLLINKLMKNIYYSQDQHETCFQSVLDLLFNYCLNNTLNQQALSKHIPYLVFLALRFDLTSGPLLGQLVTAERLNPPGQKFIQFIVRKIVDLNLQKSQFYKLLGFLVQNT